MQKVNWLTLICSFVGFTAQAQNAPLSFDAVKNLIETRQIKSIPALLPLLPEDYRQSYSLIYDSESLQGSTPLAPRVILFGDTAQSVLAFNTDPNQRGFNSLEMIDFNEKRGRFDFHKIDFVEGHAPQFSEANPPLCLACHAGSSHEPRPNWGSYPNWPNAYGSSDDLLSKDEEANFNLFKPQFATSPYYKNLIVQPGSMHSPFLDVFKGNVRFRPNARFTMLIARWNAKKLASMLMSDSRGAVLRDLILISRQFDSQALLSALELPGIERVLPAQLNAAIKADGLAIEAVRDLLGWDNSDLSLVFTKSTGPRQIGTGWNYFDGATTSSELFVNELWKELAAKDPAAALFYKQSKFVSDDANNAIFGGYPQAKILDVLGGTIALSLASDSGATEYLLGRMQKDLKNEAIQSETSSF